MNTLLVTGGGQKGYIAFHDVRKFSKKGSSSEFYMIDHHKKSINAAYVSPDGEYLVSVSQDNTVKVVKNYMDKTSSTFSLRHDNFTGRWLSTFRPCFDPKAPSTFVLGSMEHPRVVEVFSPTIIRDVLSLHRDAVLKSEFLGSVCSRNAFHHDLHLIAGCNSSGRVHIFR